MVNLSEIEDRVILGLPVTTQFGEFKTLSIYDFIKMGESIGAISMDKKYLLSKLGKSQQNETGQTDEEIFNLLKELNQKSLYSLLTEMFTEILFHYVKILRICKFYYLKNEEELDEEEFEKQAMLQVIEFIQGLSDEEFDEIRQILLALHGQSEMTAFLNPKLQRRKEKGDSLKNKNKEDGTTLTSMISSCAVYMGLDYSVIAKWNALQLQHSFQRIALFKSNEDTTYFRAYSNDVEVTDWSKNIKATKETNNDKTLEQFESNMSKQLK